MQKRSIMSWSKKLVERFKEENGSIICRELLDSMWFMTNLNLRKGRRVIIKAAMCGNSKKCG